MLANLKTALATRGVRQIDLCMKLKITPSVFSEIVHGRRQVSQQLRAKIARELRAEEEWLFSSTTIIPEPKPPKPRAFEGESTPVMA